MSLYLGIDIGGTKIAAGVVDESGAILHRSETPTPATEGGEAIIASAVRLARAASAGTRTFSGVGVGSAGVIDPHRGRVVSSTDLLSEWAGTRIAESLGGELSLPVVVQNDAHSHALGEAWLGASRGFQRSLMIAVGTGIGGALVAEGRTDPGAHFVAGHFGHVPAEEAAGLCCSCGRTGHVEAIASGPALHAAYLRAGGASEVSNTREVFARAENGDPRASSVIRRGATALGRAIGGFLNVLDPDIVVISGGLASTGELWWEPLRAGIAAEAMDSVAQTPVVPSFLGDDAAILGAARLAMESAEGTV